MNRTVIMNLISKICSNQGTKYKSLDETIYYYAFRDMEGKGLITLPSHNYLTESEERELITNITSYASSYALDKVLNNNHISLENKEIYKRIFNFGNVDVKELIMRLIAEYNNIYVIPTTRLMRLENIALGYVEYNDYLLEWQYDSISSELKDAYKVNTKSNDELWKIPFDYQLFHGSNVSSNVDNEYLNVLAGKFKPIYLDIAKILCKNINRIGKSVENCLGILCKFSDGEFGIVDIKNSSDDNPFIKKCKNGRGYTDEAGLTPILWYYKNVPMNYGYTPIDNETTENGYWPTHPVSEELEKELNMMTRYSNYVGEIVTGIDEHGNAVRSACYKYNGDIYSLVKAQFYDGNAGKVVLSNNSGYQRSDLIWVKFEPLECYVDRETNHIITKDIIISGIKAEFVNLFLIDYFGQDIHKFDSFFKSRIKSKEVFSEARDGLIETIEQLRKNPNPIIIPEATLSSEPKQNATMDATYYLNQAIDAYMSFCQDNFDGSNIDPSRADDYVDRVNDIIDSLERIERINPNTIQALRDLIEPIKKSTDINNIINDIMNDKPKFVNDDCNVITIKVLKPIIDLLVEILYSKYNDSPSTEEDRGEELKNTIKLITTTKKRVSDAKTINGDSYTLAKACKRAIEIESEYLKNDNLKQKLRELVKPLDSILDINKVFPYIINPQENNNEIQLIYDEFMNSINYVYPKIDEIASTIYNHYGFKDSNQTDNTKDNPIAPQKSDENTKRRNMFGLVDALFKQIPYLKPKRTEYESVKPSETRTIKKVESNRSKKVKPIETANFEEVKTILGLYNDGSKSQALDTFERLLESKFFSCDIGKMGDLVFVVLKNLNDDSTYIFTNKSEMGNYSFALKGNTISYNYDNWNNNKRFSLNMKQTNSTPPKRQVKHTINRYKGDIESLIQEDVYDDFAKQLITKDYFHTSVLDYDAYKTQYKLLARKGLNQATIDAIIGNIGGYIPPEIAKILTKYSPNIAKHIPGIDKIFEESAYIPF